MTAVHWDNLDCAKLLIHAGAYIDLRDAKGRTALFHAVAASRENICIAFLEAEANPDLRDNSGTSPRMLAENSKSAVIKGHFGIDLSPQSAQ